MQREGQKKHGVWGWDPGPILVPVCPHCLGQARGKRKKGKGCGKGVWCVCEPNAKAVVWQAGGGVGAKVGVVVGKGVWKGGRVGGGWEGGGGRNVRHPPHPPTRLTVPSQSLSPSPASTRPPPTAPKIACPWWHTGIQVVTYNYMSVFRLKNAVFFLPAHRCARRYETRRNDRTSEKEDRL